MEVKNIKSLELLINDFIDTLPRYISLKINEHVLLVMGFNDFSGMVIASVYYDGIEVGSHEIYQDDVSKENFYELMIENLKKDILTFKEKVVDASNAISSLTKNSDLEIEFIRKGSK